MDNTIRNYKELLVNKAGKNHVYFFNLEHEQSKNSLAKGFYCIDENGSKWLSVCAISSIFTEHYYEKLRSKYFDVNNDIQKLFYLIDHVDVLTTSKEFEHLIRIITSNIRQGSPRKFLTDSKGEKVNIEAPFNIITTFKFEE